jgi:hypothetical protein
MIADTRTDYTNNSNNTTDDLPKRKRTGKMKGGGRKRRDTPVNNELNGRRTDK